MKTHYETIVVGAGAAGMNCCLELQKNDREYLLISPKILAGESATTKNAT